MEKITYLSKQYAALIKYEVVFIPKNKAVDFLTYCKMLSTNVIFNIVNNKIKFETK